MKAMVGESPNDRNDRGMVFALPPREFSLRVNLVLQHFCVGV